MAKRKAISKRNRFEVFKRDSFTCQYCGKSSPDVILHVDHIQPVSKGGKNDLLNLVTSCSDCNLGKSNIELSDDAAIVKQKKQLDELAEKDEQVKMMINWRESLMKIDLKLTNSVIKIIKSYVDANPSEYFNKSIMKAVKKHGYTLVCEAVDSVDTADKTNEEYLTDILKSFKYIGKKLDPIKAKTHYINAILRNRINYFNEKSYFACMSKYSFTLDILKQIEAAAKRSSTSSEFYAVFDEIIEEYF